MTGSATTTSAPMNDTTAPDGGLRLREIPTASGHAFGHATLDAPANLNALSLAMIDRLAPALDRWLADPRIAGVLIDAAGDKAFCAGGDVAALYRDIRETRAMAERGKAPLGVPPLAAAFFEREYRLDHRIHTAAKPVLCWGHGIVLGGGIGLMAGASHRVVTPRTRLAMPEISIGLYPDVGGSWFLPRLPGRSGLFLALTGAPLNASDACFAGLADFTLHHEDKDAVLAAIAAEPWSGRQEADSARLGRLLAGAARSGDAGESPLRRHHDLLSAVIGHDTLADIARRLHALETHADPWLATAAQAFAKGSPTSAALSYELWRRAKHLSLAEVFRLEYDLSLGCCLHHDFAEGVRALLIDKDRQPRWQPATLADVDEAHLAAHFTPRYGLVHPLADLR